MAAAKSFKKIPGSICAPRGFKAAAVFCDIKTLGTGKGSQKGQKPDLALIVSDVPSAVAGMFTRNQVCAAPVKISAQRASKDFARAIVINSGNANACTGRQGISDAKRMTEIAAKTVAAVYLSRRSPAKPDGRGKSERLALTERRDRKITADDVLVCSTGRIGVPMPMKNIERGITQCAPLLARSALSGRQVANAIMTTDTRRKEIAVELQIGTSTIRIGGVCKGAGMIQPGMIGASVVATALGRREGTPQQSGAATKHATMLAFITTDAAVGPAVLRRALETAVAQSFNRITVDGDMSTNDSVIMLANGLAKNSKFEIRNSKFKIFRSALTYVCLELAKMIVRDGEGVTRFVTLRIHGARSAEEAEIAARAIANSSLVRTSWCGGDPNWGRILCALGYSGAKINESVVDVGYRRPGDGAMVFGCRRGQPTSVPFRELTKITSRPEFDIHVDLHSGRGEFVMYASDLTEEYVALNKGDVNDSRALGG